MPNLLRVFKRSSNRTPTFYIYVSQTKVEMLVPQIPASHLRSLEAEIKVNVAAFAVGVKKPAFAPSPELTAKTKVLSDYLEKQEGWVGTVAKPGRYVKGIASLRYGRIGNYVAGLAFFGGDVDGVKVGLIGSPESLIGAADSPATDHSLDHYLLTFLNGVAREATDPPVHPAFVADEDWLESEGGNGYAYAVDRALRPGVLPHEHRLEFLAKTLFQDDGLLVATPIYVAFAD